MERSDEHEPPARRRRVRIGAGLLAAVAAVAALGALVVLGVEVLLAAFGGVLLAVFLRALTDLLKRRVPMRDGLAYTIVVVALAALLGGVGALLAPEIGEQVDEMSETLPRVAEEARGWLEETGWGAWVLEQAEDGGSQQAASGVGGLLSTASDWGTYALTVLFVGLFAAANPGLYTRATVSMFPPRHRERVGDLLDEIGYTLRWWLVGQAFAMIVIGVSTTIVLLLFDIPLALVIGLVVGLLGFVPYLGPFLGAIPVAMLASMEGVETFVYVMVAYTVVQMIEGYVVTPLIQHRTVYLPPAFTIVAQVLLGTVIGGLGIVFATPIAAVVLVLTRFYRADFLGDPAEA